MSYLSRGLHGEPVRILQTKLSIVADGVFGLATEDALKSYQSQNGLVADGVAGPDTFMQMGLHELLRADALPGIPRAQAFVWYPSGAGHGE